MGTLALVTTFVLLVQGTWTWLHRDAAPHVRAFGVLTILLAILGLFGYWQFVNGPLVLSREFGYVLAHGEWARFWLAAFLLGCSVIAGLALRIARLAVGEATGFPRYIAIALVIGSLSAFFVEQVDSGQNSALALYSYDIWWPPLAIWVMTCLLASLLRALRLTCTVTWGKHYVDLAPVSGIGIAISVLAFFAIDQRSEIFDDSVGLWKLVVLVAAPVSLATTCYIAARRHVRTRAERVLRSISLFAGLVLALGAVIDPEHALRYLWIWAVPVAIALAFLALNVIRKFRTAGAASDIPPEAYDSKSAYVAVLIAAIALSLAALFLGQGYVGTAVATAIFFMSWAVLTDLLWQKGLLAGMLHCLRNPVKIRAGASACARAVAGVVSRAAGSISGLFKADKWWEGAFKVVGAIVLLIALAEIPNANKTIVMPFEVNSYAAPVLDRILQNEAATEADTEALGDLVTDLVVQELRLISSDLARQATLNLDSKGSSDESPSPDLYFYDSGAAEQALAESGSVDLPGGVKLPVQLLLWPIQQPTRHLLGVNVVSGTAIRLESGFALIASSSRGNTWRVEGSSGDAAAAGAPETGLGAVGSAAADSGETECGAAEPGDGEETGDTNAPSALTVGVLPELARRLAFGIVADDLGSRLYGMTKDWDAYRSYSQGLDALQIYQRSRSALLDSADLCRLDAAIENLLEAVKKDPGFGWAYYYLGLTYQEYGQALKAQDAFERSLTASPDLAAARIALAYHLAWPPAGRLSMPPGVSGGASNTGGEPGDAWALWLPVIDDAKVSWQDQASAFAGLANLEYRVLLNESQIAEPAILSSYYLAKRAVRMYDRNRKSLDNADGLSPAHASAVNLVGVILDSIERKETTIEPVEWTCLHGMGVKPTDKIPAGPYTVKALDYYRRAVELQPADATIQCNAAVAALGLGDAGPMERIRNIASVRRYTGYQIPQPTNVNDLYRKISEYGAAIQHDNIDLLSMNRAAYTYYVYRSENPEVNNDADWLLRTGLWAEEQIREAIRLAGVLGRSDLDMYRSTLAELLLALQRPAEALEVLEELDRTLPEHADLFEVRWDVAQANLCLVARGIGSEEDHLEAQSVLSRLREQDLGWDMPRHRNQPDLFDAKAAKPMCSIEPEYSLFNSDAIAVSYRMTQKYTADVICAKNVAHVTVPDIGKFSFLIWGPDGMRGNLDLDEERSGYLTLSWDLRSTENTYFARLYERLGNDELLPLTKVEPVRTYADCGRNRVEIGFVPCDSDSDGIIDRECSAQILASE